MTILFPNVGKKEKAMAPTPVLLPGQSHGQRSLVGCSPWGLEESDRTEQLHFHFSLSCLGEGDGNPLQCSCLETPRDGVGWWAAVCGVAQSWTRLKWLSSSSSSGQESLRRNGVAIMVNQRVWNAVLGCSLKNNRMISVHFQGKPFNITVIQVYAPTSNAEEAESEWFYEDLQDLLELTPKQDVLFI